MIKINQQLKAFGCGVILFKLIINLAKTLGLIYFFWILRDLDRKKEDLILMSKLLYLLCYFPAILFLVRLETWSQIRALKLYLFYKWLQIISSIKLMTMIRNSKKFKSAHWVFLKDFNRGFEPYTQNVFHNKIFIPKYKLNFAKYFFWQP